MNDHRTVLAQIPQDEMAELRLRSDAAGLRHLALYLALIALSSTAIALQPPGWPLLLPLQGVLLTFLFTLEHEATHKTPFATDWLNEAAGHFCALVLILPFTWFRYFHLAHHRHTNDPELDPELANAKPETWPAFLLYLSGLTYWRSVTRQIIVNAAGRAKAPYLPSSAAHRITLEARLMLLIYTALLSTLLLSSWLLWLWILPMLLGQPVLRLYLLAEHGRCAYVSNMLENTRTTLTNRLIRFLAWNMPYHAEHHSAPQVPFHKLPELHTHMRHALKQMSPGYAAFTRDELARLKRHP